VVLTSTPLLIEQFLDAATCRRIRGVMDAGAVEPAEILDEGIALDEDVRRAKNIEIDDATRVAIERQIERRRDEIGRFFGVPLTAREGVNFLRYAAGDFYLPHVDRAFIESWPDAAQRQVAIVVFLNSDFTGGELALIDARVDVIPREGLLVAFDAGMLHEVLPVREGTRDVIVDWFY
jgi:predicted 2-oxoglutarate/Fe(II)-dependent dioxygenase YbiX